MPVPVSDIKQALIGLGLEAPQIRYVRLPGNKLRLAMTATCRADRGAVNTLPQPALTVRVRVHKLTDVAMIGKGTANVLRTAGINTVADLAKTPNERLHEIGLRPHTIPKIRQWLADEGYNQE